MGDLVIIIAYLCDLPVVAQLFIADQETEQAILVLLSCDTPSKCILRTSRYMCLTEWDIYNTATAVTMNHSLINAHFRLFLLVTPQYWTICFITCLYKAHQNDLKKKCSHLFSLPVQST